MSSLILTLLSVSGAICRGGIVNGRLLTIYWEEMVGWLRNGGDEPLLQVCIQLTNCRITAQAAAIPRHSTFRLLWQCGWQLLRNACKHPVHLVMLMSFIQRGSGAFSISCCGEGMLCEVSHHDHIVEHESGCYHKKGTNTAVERRYSWYAGSLPHLRKAACSSFGTPVTRVMSSRSVMGHSTHRYSVLRNTELADRYRPSQSRISPK